MNATIDLKEFGGVVSALLVIGAILKNAFPNFPNRFIPAVTWLAGVLAYQVMQNGWTNPQVWLAAIIVSASATGIHSGVKNTLESGEPPSLDKPTLNASKLLMLVAFAAWCFGSTGCARFTTTQTDASFENGNMVRSVTTRATASTLFEAKSALASFKASQTDKTQSATVGSLNQESSGSITNAAQAAGEFLGAAIKASK